MSAVVLSFANQKGGVGKTTLCLQTAFYLAQAGNRVLVIDMDGQGNTSSRLVPFVKDDEGYEVQHYSGTKASELFESDPGPISPIECNYGIHLICTPLNDPVLFDKETVPLDEALNPARNCEELFKRYDYVLVDCSPSLGRRLVAALALSTHVICPVKISGFAVDGVEGLLQTINGIRSNHNPNLRLLGLLVNDMDRSVNHDRALERLESLAGDFLFKNKIRHRAPLDTASTLGIPVWDLHYGHVASSEVRTAIEEILEKINAD